MYHMAAAGMRSVQYNEVYALIEDCLDSREEWIRNAGLIALYHLNFRLKDEIEPDILLKFLSKAREDKSSVVLGTMDEIIGDLEIFNKSVWDKINNKTMYQ